MKLAAILEESIPRKFFVYRLGTNPKHLSNRDGATLEGLVSWFTEVRSMRPKYRNKLITKYEIISYSKEWGEYGKYDKEGTMEPHTPDKSGSAIGTSKQGNSQWFSFPHNGAWDFRVIKSIKFSEVLDAFEERFGTSPIPTGRGRRHFTPEEKEFFKQDIKRRLG